MPLLTKLADSWTRDSQGLRKAELAMRTTRYRMLYRVWRCPVIRLW